jgi:lipoprotein-anchoring transpeptidase ErfK/SrfK
LASTSAGIYTIDYRGNGTDAYSGHYGSNIFQMTSEKGATGVAIHQIPNELPGRYKLLGNDNLEDNRMSNGCVNLRKKDFEDLAKLQVGKGSKVYVLPEEDNNFIM